MTLTNGGHRNQEITPWGSASSPETLETLIRSCVDERLAFLD